MTAREPELATDYSSIRNTPVVVTDGSSSQQDRPLELIVTTGQAEGGRQCGGGGGRGGGRALLQSILRGALEGWDGPRGQRGRRTGREVGHGLLQPAGEVGHLSVHSQTVNISAAEAPADDSDESGGKVVVLVHRHQRSPTVSLWDWFQNISSSTSWILS